MNPADEKPSNDLLRPRDQPAVAVVLAGLLALMAALWWRHGGHRGGLIDIDRAPPLVARFQVDVNQAAWPELLQLPGIGHTLAQRIVEERQANGQFRDWDDLRRVTGIGPRTLERIKPYLLRIPQDGAIVQR